MKLVIKKSKYKNKYELECSWMLGDSDGERTESFFFDGDDKALNLMKSLKKFFGKKNRFYEPKKEHWDEDGRFFTGEKIIDETFVDKWGEYIWPVDLDEESPAPLERYNLYYYDDEGRRVEMELAK